MVFDLGSFFYCSVRKRDLGPAGEIFLKKWRNPDFFCEDGRRWLLPRLQRSAAREAGLDRARRYQPEEASASVAAERSVRRACQRGIRQEITIATMPATVSEMGQAKN